MSPGAYQSRMVDTKYEVAYTVYDTEQQHLLCSILENLLIKSVLIER